MELTIYDVIRGPVLSDEAYKLNTKLGHLSIKVHIHANKNLIAQAVEKIFNVKVASVSTLIRKGKIKRIKGTNKKRVEPREKRAIVRLKQGFSLNLFEQSAAAEQSAPKV